MTRKYNLDKCIKSFKKDFEATPTGFGATRANLLKLLKANDLVGWSHYEESGRLDRKAFSRMACGSSLVFSQREYIEAEKSAISIIVDCSGSMGGESITLTQSAVIQLIKVFDKANASYKVFGFDSGHESVDESFKDGTTYIPEDVRFYPFKHWNESLQKAIPKLGAIRFTAREGNPDYQALFLSIEDLAKRPEQRKILFFLTDSGSCSVPHMKYLDELARKLGIILIGIGIFTDAVEHCYKHNVAIYDMNGMASASFNKMLQAIK